MIIKHNIDITGEGSNMFSKRNAGSVQDFTRKNKNIKHYDDPCQDNKLKIDDRNSIDVFGFIFGDNLSSEYSVTLDMHQLNTYEDLHKIVNLDFKLIKF